MTEPVRAARFTPMLDVLRGVSQIFFLRSAPAGLILLIGMAVFMPWAALLVLLGSVAQTVAATAFGLHESIEDGLMGYNGALVGAAAVSLGSPVPAILMTVVGAFACVPVHMLLQELFDSRALRWAGLPVSTAPFCIVAGLLSTLVKPLTQDAAVTSAGGLLSGPVLGIFNQFAEVVLADGLLPGVLIALALFVGSWRIGLFGLLGSVLAIAAGTLLGIGADQLSSGLLGYSAVLVSIYLGAVGPRLGGAGRRVLLAVIGVALTFVAQWLVGLTPVPVYTWPFLLSMWAVLLVVRAVGRPASRRRVPVRLETLS